MLAHSVTAPQRPIDPPASRGRVACWSAPRGAAGRHGTARCGRATVTRSAKTPGAHAVALALPPALPPALAAHPQAHKLEIRQKEYYERLLGLPPELGYSRKSVFLEDPAGRFKELLLARQHARSALARGRPIRPPTDPNAHPLAQGDSALGRRALAAQLPAMGPLRHLGACPKAALILLRLAT